MKRPLRVLHVTFNMGIGGTEQVIRQLVTGFNPQEVYNEILCIDGYVGPIGEDLKARGIRVSAVKRNPGFDRSLIKAIRGHLKAGEFDIVHCHQYTPYLYGWLAARFTGCKVVFTEHGRFHPDRYRYKAALINPVIAMMTPAIVAISSATRDALSRYEFIPKRKIQVIYNGIAPLQADPAKVKRLRKELGIPDDAFVVGTVSRLDPVKNQAMMLQAFKRFLGKCPRGWLLMVGDGPDRETLKKLAQQNGVAGRVTFTGFIKAPANHLAIMDIFLLSSHTEGTSMTLLEAMSLGVPAVATNVGGNPEIVADKETGFLVSTDDAEAFGESILTICQSESIRHSMTVRAVRRYQEVFSLQKMVSGYKSTYYAVCGVKV